VLADPELTERQKQVLLEIYDSFRRELAPGASLSAAADGSALNRAEPASLGAELLASQDSEFAEEEAALAAGQDATAMAAEANGTVPDGQAQAGPTDTDPLQTGARG
jgi:hypothetical protein